MDSDNKLNKYFQKFLAEDFFFYRQSKVFIRLLLKVTEFPILVFLFSPPQKFSLLFPAQLALN